MTNHESYREQQEILIVRLLRLMGLFFVIWGVIHAANNAHHLIIERGILMTLNEFMRPWFYSYHFTHLAIHMAMLGIGLYLIFKGQWIHHIILTGKLRSARLQANDDGPPVNAEQ